MGRVLRRLGARRGRPKPTVACPLSERHRRRRLAKVRTLLSTLPDDEVAVYEDESDIHLNPKIGVDWMPRGIQKEVLTPGKNAKACVARALNARSRDIVWAGGGEKTSALFVALLDELERTYPAAQRIHVILDNYGIHYSHETRSALRRLGRIRLHFVPPYCPDHNAIERFWQDLHANVTRSHKHADLPSLCGAVAEYLDDASPSKNSQPRGGGEDQLGPERAADDVLPANSAEAATTIVRSPRSGRRGLRGAPSPARPRAGGTPTSRCWQRFR
jgi:transposase